MENTQQDTLNAYDTHLTNYIKHTNPLRSTTITAVHGEMATIASQLDVITEMTSRLEKACTIIEKGKHWYENQPDNLQDGEAIDAVRHSAKNPPNEKEQEKTIDKLDINPKGQIEQAFTRDGKSYSASEVPSHPFNPESAAYYLDTHDKLSKEFIDTYLTPAVDLAQSAGDIKSFTSAVKTSIAQPFINQLGGKDVDIPKNKYTDAIADKSTKSEHFIAQAQTPSNLDVKKLLKEADSIVGNDTPYAWGAGGTDGPSKGTTYGSQDAATYGDDHKTGFDCSGLTQYLTYQARGIDIGKHTTTQFTNSDEVDPIDLQVGDLGFNKDQTHVVMYVGNDKVVEAPDSGQRVTYSDVNKDMSWRRPRG